MDNTGILYADGDNTYVPPGNVITSDQHGWYDDGYDWDGGDPGYYDDDDYYGWS